MRLLFIFYCFQLVQWINEAGMSDGPKKVNILRKTIEILLHQGSQHIPLFLENVLSYGNDKSSDVKKQVIIFIEQLRWEALSLFKFLLKSRCAGGREGIVICVPDRGSYYFV